MFVGLDVHKKYTEVAIVDEDGVIEKVHYYSFGATKGFALGAN